MKTKKTYSAMKFEGLDADSIPELSRVDDAPRKLIRGSLLKKSAECKKNRHRLCSSSHCNCSCHDIEYTSRER